MDKKIITTQVAIIGGGASGLICGCVAGKKYKTVIIEKEKRIGKKLLATGNGRCNLTNINADINDYMGSFKEGVKFLLQKYPPEFIIDYFAELGLVCKADLAGRVYPLCKQASAVLDILRNCLSSGGVSEICETAVTDIVKTKNGFKIIAENLIVKAEKVVIAAGGCAQSKLGSDGSGLKILKKLGHTVTPLNPALTSIKVNSNVMKSLKGIRIDGKVTLISNNKIIKTEKGEIQFTENALSGICVFNISSLINKVICPVISLNLLADIDNVENFIKARADAFKNYELEKFFTGLFHKNIGFAVLKESNIFPLSRKVSTLSDKDIKIIANTITDWRFTPVLNNDFSKAQVTSGGISGNEINFKTMESKIIPNLYICGETVDVNGYCGGFNLQFAFSSGILAGESL